ncbi:MAG TPA: toll/interleukin-1 receptor domain-containing protein [Solirubrobacter sp.]|nr:toll/interleukin-1 receptor domain-containing protein [Solirubrobacter sp.]
MYRLVFLHRGDDTWADEVDAAVRGVARSTLLRDDVIVRSTLAEAEADRESPAVVIYLASADAAVDADVTAALEAARAASFPVLPVAREETGLHLLLPAGIRRLNAVIWDGSGEPALKIARLLGLVESERKLFLSYRRTESESLALQLRRALSERGYDVFLDRFSVPPAVDFQRRLDAELADKAFVLLLESASAVGSDWVQHEVSYALSHQIAVLALSLPDADPDGRFGVIDDAFRLPVDAGDLAGAGAGRTLRDAAFAHVLDVVELQTARQLRRRREQLLGSLGDFLFRAGARRSPLGGWALLAEHAGARPKVYLVTPRAPSALDLRTVDRLREETRIVDCAAAVVHDVADRDADHAELLAWIADGRRLSVEALTDVGEELMP